MSDTPQTPASGLQVNAGPVMVQATGNMVIQVLLAGVLFGGSAYAVWTTHQQTILLTAQHNAIMAGIAALTMGVNNLAQANENVFLSSMLPDARKKNLPDFIQDKARAIVQRRAASITENSEKTAVPEVLKPAFPANP